jgi:chromosome segregation ATPase
VAVSAKELKQEAFRILKGKAKDFRLDLIALSLKGKKVSMEKVIGMVDDMVTLLGKEQDHDDSKKEECEVNIDKTEDKHKDLNAAIADLDKAIDETKETIANLGDEIASLSQGIKDLDKQVAEATATRKEENEDYVSTMAANNAAVELLKFAKNRLNKFYNPKMYKEAPKREMSEEERITVNMGGSLAPTAPAGIAGTGISALQGAPPPPPETFGAYAKKSEESTGVIAMVNALVGDLQKENAAAEVEEKDAQQEYEKFIEDSATKRQYDAKSILDKEAAKADAEATLIKLDDELKGSKTENLHTIESLQDLHQMCDWLLQNYETRKEARAGEVDALKKAKAVLSGADYSLIQVGHVHVHRRHA